jgi:hypothetical protein
MRRSSSPTFFGSTIAAWCLTEGHDERAAQDVGRISLGAQRREAIAKYAARKGSQPERGFVMPATLDTLQNVQKLVGRYRGDWALCDAGPAARETTAPS